MRIDFRVNHDDFDKHIDFTEAQVFFSSPIERMCTFQAWGIAVLCETPLNKELKKHVGQEVGNYNSYSSLYKELKKHLEVEGDIYVSGMVSVIFPNVETGVIEVALFKESGEGFLYGPEGIVRVTRRWGNTISSSKKEYYIDFISDWPFGSGNLRIYAENEFILSIDVKDCIPLSWYVENPEKYAYQMRVKD
ncbi:hypothetical protein [Paenibacillus luteus]|uniref:hypothetical protein n=1 Tax=Paenibacillus luteus TaxID=2545753 RepID=UPI0011417D7E|nr:hypothetical protein [Paenibacillus luteus]